MGDGLDRATEANLGAPRREEADVPLVLLDGVRRAAVRLELDDEPRQRVDGQEAPVNRSPYSPNEAAALSSSSKMRKMRSKQVASSSDRTGGVGLRRTRSPP